MLSKWNPYSGVSPSFDTNLIFGVKDGFDIVIGNPPYISYGLRGVGKLSSSEMETLKRNYSGSAEYKVSLYAIFMELAIRLCKQNGLQTYIVPDSFLLGRYFSKIRGLILEKNNILSLSFFVDQVFKATVGISVIYLFKKDTENSIPLQVFKIDDIKKLGTVRETFSFHQDYYATQPRNRFRLFFSHTDKILTDKLEQGSTPLKNYISFSSGLIGKKGQDSIKSSTRLSASWKPGIPSGGNVKKFDITREDLYINFNPSVIKSGYNCVDYSADKIFLRQTGDSLICALDTEKLLALNNVHIGTAVKSTDCLKAIVCILNSNLLTWYYQTISLEKGRAMAQLDIDMVDLLPIRIPEDTSALSLLYDTVVTNYELKKKQLNDAIYRLYGLAKNEIEHIEKSLSIDKVQQKTVLERSEMRQDISENNQDNDARD